MDVLNHLASDDAGPENGHPGTEDIVTDALIDRFKTVVAEFAGIPFEETLVKIPQRSVWLGYARAAIAAMEPRP